MIFNRIGSTFSEVYEGLKAFPKASYNYFISIFKFPLSSKMGGLKDRMVASIKSIELPKFNFISRFFNRVTTRLHRPASIFGFNDSHMRDLETIYRQAQNDPSIQIKRVRSGIRPMGAFKAPKTTVIVTQGSIDTSYTFPHKVDFHFADGKLSAIYVKHTREKLGSGGFAVVYLTQELISCQEFARKRMSGGKWEEEFLKQALKLTNKQGLFLPATLLLSGNKPKIITKKGIPLSNHLNFTNNKHLRNVMEDLLVGLNTIHSMKFTNQELVIPKTGGLQKMIFEETIMSHQDIKPGNILLQKDPKRGYKAGFMDFDTINPLRYAEKEVNYVIGTPFFRSPVKLYKYVEFENYHLDIGRLVSNNIQGPQLALHLSNYKKLVNEYFTDVLPKEDIWALGITFLSILSKGQSSGSEIPNLKFIIDASQKYVARPPRLDFEDHWDAYIRDIRDQSEIDNSIDKFFSAHIDPRLNPNDKMKNLIKGMLQVDYNERFNAKHALEAFKGVFS